MSRLARLSGRVFRLSFIWIGLLPFLIIGVLLMGGFVGADFKAGQPEWYWLSLMILILTFPLALGIIYLNAWVERLARLDVMGIPDTIFWLWNSIIGVSGLLWGLSLILMGQYEFYAGIVRQLIISLMLVYLVGTAVLLVIPQHKPVYKRMSIIVIGFMMSMGLLLGLIGQRDSIFWFLSQSPDSQDRMQGRKEYPKRIRTVRVIFQDGLTTQEWERYLARINWSFFGYAIEQGSIRVATCDGVSLAVIDEAMNNLEQVRAQYAQSVSDRDWYTVCVSEMSATGPVDSDFEKIMQENIGLNSVVKEIVWGEILGE